MIGPAVLPPSPAAVAEYFRRRRSTISEFSPDDILNNERLWVVEACGLPESALDPAPIITREEAARLDDPFSNKRKFGPRGQYTKCAGCGDVFESLGLRHVPVAASRATPPRRSAARNVAPPCLPTAEKPSSSARMPAVRKLIAGEPPLRILRPDILRDRNTRVSVTPVQADQALTDPPIRNTTAARCVGCRREFQPRRKDTKFCSAACKQRTYRLGKLVEGQRRALEGASA
jgi:hypothetical protein